MSNKKMVNTARWQTKSMEKVSLKQLKERLNGATTVVDSAIFGLYPSFFPQNSLVFKCSEDEKTLANVEKICKFLLKMGVNRDGCVVAVGGGLVGDIVGLAASIYMRGIDWIFVPTTLLSLVDSSVGGKTAANLGWMKNAIGTFHRPKQVIFCPSFLATLDEMQIKSGVAEMVKTAALDRKTYQVFMENSDISCKHLPQNGNYLTNDAIISSQNMENTLLKRLISCCRSPQACEKNRDKVVCANPSHHDEPSISNVCNDNNAPISEAITLHQVPTSDKTVHNHTPPSDEATHHHTPPSDNHAPPSPIYNNETIFLDSMVQPPLRSPLATSDSASTSAPSEPTSIPSLDIADIPTATTSHDKHEMAANAQRNTPEGRAVTQNVEITGDMLLEKLLHTCRNYKKCITSNDFHDNNCRQWLNFGHTVGHSLELNCNLPHGIAVALGMRIEVFMADATEDYLKNFIYLQTNPIIPKINYVSDDLERVSAEKSTRIDKIVRQNSQIDTKNHTSGDIYLKIGSSEIDAITKTAQNDKKNSAHQIAFFVPINHNEVRKISLSHTEFRQELTEYMKKFGSNRQKL